MDFAFSPEERAFHKELRSFLEREVPGWYPGIFVLDHADYERAWEFSLAFAKRLAGKGWLVRNWPQDYGGAGASIWEQVLFSEEMVYFEEPRGANYMGPNWVGPTIMKFGTPEQKAEHLPRIASAEVIWCQGFSEPGAGSDLAAVETRARQDGDDFIVDGQKIWTSYADHADWCILVVRTDPDAPKHKGLSYLLVDMRSQGVTVRPIPSLFGDHFCQVFYDHVRVPRRNLLGEKNGAWQMMMASLGYERAGVPFYMEARRRLEQLADALKQQRRHLDPAVAANLSLRLAEQAVEVETAKWLTRRAYWLIARDLPADAAASQAKMFKSEVYQRTANAALQGWGLLGQLERGDRRAPLDGRFLRMFYWCLEGTVAGGTSEIQRNIVAQRGLGLPRG
ncbi:MAG: acyl-CoA dehydrogenase family protein [Chloroflexi bacterium]|nr:acyl-CoA dehydrogenase family protein [Chloroflexota bacterium]